MKKVLLVSLLAVVGLMAKEPVSYGILKGDIKSYYPSIRVTNAFLVSNTLTTGIVQSKPQALYDTTMKFVQGFADQAKRSCKDSYGYAIDHVDTKYTTFGEYGNTFIYVSANIVCFDR